MIGEESEENLQDIDIDFDPLTLVGNELVTDKFLQE